MQEGVNIRDALRAEIVLRLNRETAYVLALADMKSIEGGNFLKDQLKQNDEALKLINEFLSMPNMYKVDKDGNQEVMENILTDWDWEKFVKERYWDKK